MTLVKGLSTPLPPSPPKFTHASIGFSFFYARKPYGKTLEAKTEGGRDWVEAVPWAQPELAGFGHVLT